MREDELLQVTNNFLTTHDRWTESNEQSLPEHYESSVEELLSLWADGDIPGHLRQLAGAVEQLRSEWISFQGYRSLRQLMPRGGFWGAVTAVLTERNGSEVEDGKTIEPVALLRKQGVSDNQIARHIYGHNDVGPFLQGNRVRADLIDREANEPGSVLGKDWVHPLEAGRRRDQQELQQRRIARTRALAKTHGDAPESIEELLQQGVSVQQISAMKGVSKNEVVEVAKKIGAKISDAPQISRPTPVATVTLTDDPEGDDDDDGRLDDTISGNGNQAGQGESIPAANVTTTETDPVNARIIELSGNGMGAVDIAQNIMEKFGQRITTQKVIAVVREHGRRKLAETSPASA